MSTSRTLITCVVTLALTACQNDGSGPSEGATRPESGDSSAALTQPEVFGVARAINEGEVEQATAVQARLTDPEARVFAEQMIRDHRAAVEQLDLLQRELGVAPADSALREDLVRESQEVMQRLSGASADAVDEEYLESQVAAHRRALDVFDNQLIPAAGDDRLRQQLTTMREQVAMHLQHAEQLKSK